MGRKEGVARGGQGRRWLGYLLSLPILSISLVAVVLAFQVAGTPFVIFDDGALRVEAQVDEVLRRNPVQGIVEGQLTVTNGHPFDILLLKVQLTVLSGTWDEADEIFRADAPPVRLNVHFPTPTRPLLVHSGESVTQPFARTLSGDAAALGTGSDFQVLGEIEWAEVRDDGSLNRLHRAVTLVCVDVGQHLMASGAVGFEACQEL